MQISTTHSTYTDARCTANSIPTSGRAIAWLEKSNKKVTQLSCTIRFASKHGAVHNANLRVQEGNKKLSDF